MSSDMRSVPDPTVPTFLS